MKLFEPNKVGSHVLRHRVVMASLARMRASDDGLTIAESTIVSLRDRGYLGARDIYNDGQVARWKAITDTIHAKGEIVFLQIWHGGWQSHADNELNHGLPIATSAIADDGVVHTKDGWKLVVVPRALEIFEIAEIIEDFRAGAERTREAGFDGVERHSASGYLLDELLQNGSNRRTYRYVGLIENRDGLLLEVTGDVAGVLGADRRGVRTSPSSPFGGMSDGGPIEIFGYVARELDKRRVGYLQVVEPQVQAMRRSTRTWSRSQAGKLRPSFSGLIIAADGGTDHRFRIGRPCGIRARLDRQPRSLHAHSRRSSLRSPRSRDLLRRRCARIHLLSALRTNDAAAGLTATPNHRNRKRPCHSFASL